MIICIIKRLEEYIPNSVVGLPFSKLLYLLVFFSFQIF